MTARIVGSDYARDLTRHCRHSEDMRGHATSFGCHSGVSRQRLAPATGIDPDPISNISGQALMARGKRSSGAQQKLRTVVARIRYAPVGLSCRPMLT